MPTVHENRNAHIDVFSVHTHLTNGRLCKDLSFCSLVRSVVEEDEVARVHTSGPRTSDAPCHTTHDRDADRTFASMRHVNIYYASTACHVGHERSLHGAGRVVHNAAHQRTRCSVDEYDVPMVGTEITHHAHDVPYDVRWKFAQREHGGGGYVKRKACTHLKKNTASCCNFF
jgi:hypothetical protein